MSIDMSQFHGVFFEESQEHLNDMEHLLMGLQLESPDAEDLNSIFRAAHSIKGGSGIFGFDALTGLTHVMENLLDNARKDQLKLTTEIVDTLLATVDILKSILDAYRNDGDINWGVIEQGTQRLEAVLLFDDSTESEVKEEGEEEAFGLFSTSPSEEEAFGFFDEKEAASDAEPFGLFEPVAQKDESEAFGLFEPISDIEKETASEAPQEPVQAPVKPPEVKSKAPKASAAQAKDSSSIRVDTNKIDSLVNLVGQLVITKSMISMVGNEVEGEVHEKLNSAVEELSRNVGEIQEAVMSMRMLPMSFVFNRFPRVVRDLSSQLGKKITLEIDGGNTEIDKGMIEKLVDPLTHLVRNSIDHGIEMPDIRTERGKPIEGTVVLRAEQRGSAIVISIIDDGAGLNRDRILDKARENNIPVDDYLSDTDVWNLIFAPGFSTAAEVTDVSGRGVGMDVVKRNIETIGGSVNIESHEGVGSTFSIHLPLTLAIVDGMSVSTGGQVFIVPLTNIIESIQPDASQVKNLANDNLLWVREEYWPVIALHESMQLTGAEKDPTQAIIVLIETSTKRFGLLVDALVGQQQVVIKSLEQHYKRVPGVAGATIMGDGSVALILDVESLASTVKMKESSREVASV